jgi:hypothetical protein
VAETSACCRRVVGRGGPVLAGPHAWWREVLVSFADETTEEVIVAKSSQVGYTER